MVILHTTPDWYFYAKKGDCVAYVGPNDEYTGRNYTVESVDLEKKTVLVFDRESYRYDMTFKVDELRLRQPTPAEALGTNRQGNLSPEDQGKLKLPPRPEVADVAPVAPGPEHPPGPTGYVDDNPKTAAGAAKPPTFAIPGTAIIALGMAMQNGLEKYGLTNWREFPVTVSTYYNAAERHMLEFNDGHTFDKFTGIHNLAHAMACLAIIIDAQCQGTVTDDRTKFPGKVSELINLISEGKANALREPR